jgi:hypothetical protein
MTETGHIRLNDEYSLVLVNKCASTTFKNSLVGERFNSKAEITTPKAIMVIRNPLERICSFWRMKRRDKIGPLFGDIDSFVLDALRTPDEARDPHICSYQRYIAHAPHARLIALEKLSEQWPVDLPRPFGDRKENKTTDTGEKPSPEVVEAFEEAYMADFLLWEEAVAEMEDE